jgi:predicted RNA-binding protein with PIN domain
VADETLYLFDGYNLLHAGSFRDPRELVDALAGFVAVKGARGIVVFDGVGSDRTVGALEVRYAPSADTLLERLAAEHRALTEVVLVSSDTTVRETAGIEVTRRSSANFMDDLAPPATPESPPAGLAGRLDEATRARLERLRRGKG